MIVTPFFNCISTGEATIEKAANTVFPTKSSWYFNNIFSVKVVRIIVIFRFPAELHIVHFNQKYDNFTEASKHSDGLAVLAILIEVFIFLCRDLNSCLNFQLNLD